MSLTVSSTLTIMALISRSNNTADEKEPNQIEKQKQRVIEAILLFFVYCKPISEGGSYESPSFSFAFSSAISASFSAIISASLASHCEISFISVHTIDYNKDFCYNDSNVL